MGIGARIKSAVATKTTAAAALAMGVGLAGQPALAAGHDDGSLRTYIFGHSLINNAESRSAVPYWMVQLAKADQRKFDYAGQFGFMQGHAEGLPPTSQWGFDGAQAVWNDQVNGFSDIDFDSVLMTAGNFMQWLPPSEAMDGGSKSVVAHTLTVIDWVSNAEPGIEIVVYENWPDMAAFTANESFPPSASEFANYNDYTKGAFHDWWNAYEADLRAARPNVNIRTIPVGSTLAKLMTETDLLAGIPVTDLYYDSAPHGTQSLYFLASLVTYAGMFEKAPPSGINVPNGIHPTIQQNYDGIVRFIASELGVR